MKRRMKIIFRITVCFIISFLFLSAAGCSSAKVTVMPTMQNNFDFSTKSSKVIVAETRTLDTFLTINATIIRDETEDLSFTINNCKFKAVYVKNGDMVEEGQLLAELDASDLEYQLAELNITLEKVRLMYDRVQNETGMNTSDKRTQQRSLELDMEATNLNIAHIQSQIEKTKLKAPFSGVITDLTKYEPGTYVPAYTKFMTIWKPGNIMLVSEVLNPYNRVNSLNLSGIVTGMSVTLVYGSGNNALEIPATITKIINLDPGVTSNPNRILSNPQPFQLYFKPDGDNTDKLYVDRSLPVKIYTGTLEDVVVLPKSAIRGFGIDQMLKIKKGDKTITRRITVGYVDNKEGIVVITNGLRPGENVILK